MSNKNISDFVILGGGCSALSFINQVIEKKITKYSFIIIEKKKKLVENCTRAVVREAAKGGRRALSFSEVIGLNEDDRCNPTIISTPQKRGEKVKKRKSILWCGV